jgi:signal transduction histidine kinase
MGDRAVPRGDERLRQHESIAQLWAQAAHDLRQPVQSALLVMRMLDEGAARAEQKRAARHVAAALESLSEMLNTLTLMARIKAGLQVVPLRICELSDVLGHTVREMTKLAAERGISLRFRSVQGLVRSHPKLLVLATRSVLLNAIKFGNGDRILACCRRCDGQLRLEVQYKGASPDGGGERNAFVQLSPLVNRSIASELGLGLSMLEHLCRRLGHSLHHAKLPRNGQLLAIELPLARISL